MSSAAGGSAIWWWAKTLGRRPSLSDGFYFQPKHGVCVLQTVYVSLDPFFFLCTTVCLHLFSLYNFGSCTIFFSYFHIFLTLFSIYFLLLALVHAFHCFFLFWFILSLKFRLSSTYSWFSSWISLSIYNFLYFPFPFLFKDFCSFSHPFSYILIYFPFILLLGSWYMPPFLSFVMSCISFFTCQLFSFHRVILSFSFIWHLFLSSFFIFLLFKINSPFIFLRDRTCWFSWSHETVMCIRDFWWHERWCWGRVSFTGSKSHYQVSKLT